MTYRDLWKSSTSLVPVGASFVTCWALSVNGKWMKLRRESRNGRWKMYCPSILWTIVSQPQISAGCTRYGWAESMNGPGNIDESICLKEPFPLPRQERFL